MTLPLPPSFQDLSRAAGRRLLQAVGGLATYVALDGTRRDVLAAEAEGPVAVGDFAVTLVQRTTLDVLTEEIPEPEQGAHILFADGRTFEIDRKETDDGVLSTLIVSRRGPGSE